MEKAARVRQLVVSYDSTGGCVKPLNKGRLGDIESVLYSDVSSIRW